MISTKGKKQRSKLEIPGFEEILRECFLYVYDVEVFPNLIKGQRGVNERTVLLLDTLTETVYLDENTWSEYEDECTDLGGEDLIEVLEKFDLKTVITDDLEAEAMMHGKHKGQMP